MTSDADAESGPAHPPLNLIGLGASAGGIKALKDFFSDVPADSGIVFVVVVHLSPEHSSSLAEVLQPACRMPVQQVQGRTRMEPDHVYVIPPNRNLSVTDGHLALSEFDQPRGQRSPIDTFFRTIAYVHPDGVGVLLSGSGSDGVVGLKAIKEAGGLIMAQMPDEAEYGAMPRSAIATGLVDFVLPARELGTRVVELRRKGISWKLPYAPERLSDGDGAVVQRILAQVRSRTGHDFSAYKKTTVLRRIGRRMQVRQASSLQEYLDQLAGSSGEARDLMKDLLISVTSFFRDPEAFDALEETVIPKLFEGLDEDDEVRVWVPGCATGEEAYSIAILLAERAEKAAHRPSIQIFATDLDEEAIGYAREGLYPEPIAADLTPERLQRFFVKEGAFRRVRKELREMILFSHHSLLRDPPFSRIDLVSSRNLLIYLERDMQEQVLRIFHYALNEDGYLFLGSSESVEEGHGFKAVEATRRLYQRTTRPAGAGSHLPELPLSSSPLVSRAAPSHRRSPRTSAQEARAHLEVLERHGPPSVLVDRHLGILHVFGTAGRYLEIPEGAPTLNLLKVLKLELRLELRSSLARSARGGAAVVSRPVAVEMGGEARSIRLYVRSLDEAETAGAALVTFLESDRGDGGGDAETRRDLSAAETDLDLARDQIEDMIDESETRQEELQAANEELQSINEEYKSTLEELETSKEELQSMNEELKTVNTELTSKVDALASAIDDLKNLMAATEIGTLFLDRELRIKRFTPALTDFFNIMPIDEGRPLAHLTHGLDYGQLIEDCEQVLRTLQPVEREVGNGGGHHYLARVTPYRTEDHRISGVVATFTDVTRLRRAQEALAEAKEKAEAAANAKSEFLSMLSHELRTPLNAVIGMADLIREELVGPVNEQQQDYLSRIKSSAWYQLSMIEEVLSFTQAEAGKAWVQREEMDVAEIAREVVGMLENMARQRGLELKHGGLDPSVPIVTDGGKVRQILTNLIGNALKFTDEGTVVLELTNCESGVVVSVRDTGPGIPEDRLEEIFESFTQLDNALSRKAGGSGLGLAVSRRLARLLGGDIEVESGVGEGSVFTLRLPDLREQETSEERTAAAPGPGS